MSDVVSPAEQLTPRGSESCQQAHQGNGSGGKPLPCGTVIPPGAPELTSTRAASPQDQKRTEKVTKRVNAIQEVKESVALLSQLLQDYHSTGSSQSNTELVQVTRQAHSFRPMGERRGERSRLAVCVCVCVCVSSGPVPALREDETYALQTGERHGGQRRGSG